MRTFETGQTVVRRDVHGSGRVRSEHALRVVADTSEALVAACPPGAETRWPALYVKARDDGDRSVRTEAFDAMATGVWELADAVWQETELLLWKPPTAWFSVNAFYTSGGLRNWYVNFEHPTRRTTDGFDTFDLTVDLVVDRPDQLGVEGRRRVRARAAARHRHRHRAPGRGRRPRPGHRHAHRALRPVRRRRLVDVLAVEPGLARPPTAAPDAGQGGGCTDGRLNRCLDGCPQRGTKALRPALDDVLDLVVRATGEQLQIVGTGSQGDTVTSPLARRFTS
ncbi:DUF402 domain-containing protein [Streptomyces sp. NPDC086091]|uniref:DUF402 domain-containing protein n=1 Tax=Streptomyces sp. NPDC086091 TaxID=3365751 RepID=UPI00382DB5D2